MKNETSINNFFLSDGQTALPKLTHGSLFSGIGGFELGATWANIETIWNCEIKDWNRKILNERYPTTKQYNDIRELQSPEYVDIISGGFPCQDISISNTKAGGIKASRSGIWSEMFRIIWNVRPKYVIIENSSAITFRGLERVLCDLSEIGYDAEWQCLSGTNFGIQQGRERAYIIAYPNCIGCEGQPKEQMVFTQPPQQFMRVAPGWRTRRDLPEPKSFRKANDIPGGLHRVKGLGNAVMPVIAYYLFYCIQGREKKIINTVPTAHTNL